MTIRWFTSSGEKAFRGKVSPRKSPTPPKTKSPRYKTQEPVHRVPKLRKPRVERPFAETPPAVATVTAASGVDNSYMELAALDSSPGIESISWVFGGRDGCDGTRYEGALTCDDLNGSEWGSLREFLDDRGMASSNKGQVLGMYGHSHPGCTCRLRVTLSDGSSRVLGPYS